MRSHVLTIAALVASAAVATPIHSRYATKEAHAVPREWTRIDEAPRRHTINLQIGIRPGSGSAADQPSWAQQQQQQQQQQQPFYDEDDEDEDAASDPEHAAYGEHLSQAEVNELAKPAAADSLALVEEWLSEHVDLAKAQYSPAKDFITVSLPVADAERLLRTRFSTYQHNDGSRLVRTHEWSLPRHLHEHVTAVQPTTAFIRTVPA